MVNMVDVAVGNKLNEVEIERARRIASGRLMASPPEGEEVVITGMAGRFPNSDDVYEFRDNLFNKVDLCDDDERRWEHTHPEIPKRSGKINHAEKFDADFFGIHQREVNSLDPLGRAVYERMFEAILDAGVHPSELAGTRTGVIIGSCLSESVKHICFDDLRPGGNGMTGANRSMQAQRLSYWLKLEGFSYVVDTACSSAAYALEHAYKAMRSGQCDAVLVGGANLCLHPFLTQSFANLGVLSHEGVCRPFDEGANGYTRSEAIAAVFLQKSKDARRIYARLIHAKVNVDGYKEQGITYPSGDAQGELLREVYEEAGVDLNDISYMEAHGTGTRVGDPEELKALDAVFEGKRTRPLLVGSVKSSIGHTEPVSGLCSLVKVLIGMESGYIPPNINFTQMRKGVAGLESGRLKVVDATIPWPDQHVIAGVNCFGFGGANCHALIEWNPKSKINNGQPDDKLPRLIAVSGRTEEAVLAIIDDLKARKLDAEYVRLLHEIFKKEITGHLHRGYTIVSVDKELERSVVEYTHFQKDVYFVVGDIDQFDGLKLEQMMDVTYFVNVAKKANLAFKRSNLQVRMDKLIKESSLISKFVSSAVLQIALVDMFMDIGLEYNFIPVGILGELVQFYSNGGIDFEHVILAAYQTANVLEKNMSNRDPNVLSNKLYEELKKILEAKYAQHLAQQLLLPQNVAGNLQKIQSNSIVVKFGNKLPGEILELLDEHVEVENLMEESENAMLSLLHVLGSLCNSGASLSLDKLYPSISWPVSRGTPMISPVIKWKHDKSWFLTKFGKLISNGVKKVTINTNNTDKVHLKGHVIDGRNLYPATGYIMLVWECFSILQQKIVTAMQLVFENVKFNRATTIGDEKLEFIVSIRRSTGDFEVLESDFPVVTGRVYEAKNIADELVDLPIPAGEFERTLYEKDVYKELRLRGYNYRGLFRGIQEFRGSEALVQWHNDWVAFMDNMLQLQILQEDTRMLFVPTQIQRLVIDAKNHVKHTMNLTENASLPVHVYKDAEIIRSEFIEIRGLQASSIPRRKALGEPVLEKYRFASHSDTLPVENAMRINVQLLLENNSSHKFKIAEIFSQSGESKCEELLTMVQNVFDDEPLVKAEMVQILAIDKDFDGLMAGSNLVFVSKLSKHSDASQILKSLPHNAFLISRETLSFNANASYTDMKAVTALNTSLEILMMYRKLESKLSKQSIIDVSNSFDNFAWLPVLQQQVLASDEVILVSQNCDRNGILGLTNCLRREPGLEQTRCVFILDPTAPKFDINLEFYQNHLAKGLNMNVYKNGHWGSYRHLLLDQSSLVGREHCYGNTIVRGDLSSLRWIEGPLRSTDEHDIDSTLVHIYVSSLNFRDVMVASGRINVDVLMDRREQECVQGFEYSGRNQKGERVMGIHKSGALASLIAGDSYLLWRVPSAWSLEDAATVPIVYSTVLYALLLRANMQRGATILIHSGTGGVGQAAINVALHYQCTVFTTVGTPDKRDFIRRHYPQIRPEHIGNSRDCSFEQMIMTQTRGRGVDLVLNSLAEEKLQASVRCVARGGSFIEIGKFDLMQDNSLRMALFTRQASFHGVMLDKMFYCGPHVKARIVDVVQQGIDQGYVRPLPKTCFKQDEIEDAYRFLTTGKHIGKVLVRIRREESEAIVTPTVSYFNCLPRFYCKKNSSYVILGGLGGMGLELADWLVLRGARYLVLTSRSGVKTGYQEMRLKIWKSYGVEVVIAVDDILTKDGCRAIIDKAQNLGPVDSVFNLAVVLRDAVIANQTRQDYQMSFGPKPYTTQYFDELTRELCPDLRDFVVFSSVSCGRGNAGQTNYGMANSIMERICEQRHMDGFPAVAIQWGAIGDVGLVAELQEEHTDLVIGGTLQQRVASCLEVLDRLLRQPEPVVASMVVAEKKAGSGDAANIFDAVVNIMGIRDLKTVSLHSTLPELGMDSMMAVEIKQTLEREYEVYLTPQDIRTLTFARLQELSEAGDNADVDASKSKDSTEKGVQFMMKLIGNEDLARQAIVPLKTSAKIIDPALKVTYFLPGVEGVASIFDALAPRLSFNAKCLQYCPQDHHESITKMAEHLLKQIPKGDLNHGLNLIGYSYGALLALEMLAVLEKQGVGNGNLIIIDGSPLFSVSVMKQQLQLDNDAVFETSLLVSIMANYLPLEKINPLMGEIMKCKNFEERTKIVLDNSPSTHHSPEFLRDICISSYLRIKSLKSYQPKFGKLDTKVKLLRAVASSVSGIAHDYGLSELCKHPVEVLTFEGDHFTILESLGLAEEVERSFGITDLDKANLFSKSISHGVETVNIK